MKTIATAAAAFMMLTATAWAEDPIQLSDAEMDEVTAGAGIYSNSSMTVKFEGDGSTRNSSDGIVGPKTWSYQVSNNGKSSQVVDEIYVLIIPRVNPD